MKVSFSRGYDGSVSDFADHREVASKELCGAHGRETEVAVRVSIDPNYDITPNLGREVYKSLHGFMDCGHPG